MCDGIASEPSTLDFDGMESSLSIKSKQVLSPCLEDHLSCDYLEITGEHGRISFDPSLEVALQIHT